MTKSAESIDFEVTNKFQLVGKFTYTESANNQVYTYMYKLQIKNCVILVIPLMTQLNADIDLHLKLAFVQHKTEW